MEEPTETPHLNIGIIGDHASNQIHLALALTDIGRPVGNVPSFADMSGGGSANLTFLEYRSVANHYAHIVFPSGVEPSVLYRHLASLDGCVVYVGSEGITPTTRAQVIMASAAGVSNAVVFVDQSAELSVIARNELTSLLNDAGFSPDSVPVVHSSAVASTEQPAYRAEDATQLLSFMDRLFVARRGGQSKAFLMPVENVFSIEGRGVIVTGRIDRGIVRKGQSLELVGSSGIIATKCVDIETFNQKMEFAAPGDHVGILVSQVQKNEVSSGTVLAEPGSLALSDQFLGRVYLERPTEIPTEATFLFRTAVVSGDMTPAEDKPTDDQRSIALNISLSSAYALENGLRFVLLKKGEFLGNGSVLTVQRSR